MIAANQNVKQNVNLIVGNISERVVVTAQGPPKPAALLPAGTPRRIRVGGNVEPLRMTVQVKPVYPASAVNSGIEGTVSLQTIIGADGTVQAIRVLGSIDPDLTAAAVEAVEDFEDVLGNAAARDGVIGPIDDCGVGLGLRSLLLGGHIQSDE